MIFLSHIVVLAYILVGGALLIVPGPIIYIVENSHERCTGIHWLF